MKPVFCIYIVCVAFILGGIVNNIKHKCEVPEVKEDIRVEILQKDVKDLEERLQIVIYNNGLAVAQ